MGFATELRFPAAFIAAILSVVHPPFPLSVAAEVVTNTFDGLIQSPLVPAQNLP